MLKLDLIMIAKTVLVALVIIKATSMDNVLFFLIVFLVIILGVIAGCIVAITIPDIIKPKKISKDEKKMGIHQ